MYQSAKNFLQSILPAKPKVAVILGSGLGAFADELTGAISIPYTDIPDWPRSTAIGHAGRLVAGRLDTGKPGGIDVVALSGRVHLYEGYTPQQVTFGIRVLGLPDPIASSDFKCGRRDRQPSGPAEP